MRSGRRSEAPARKEVERILAEVADMERIGCREVLFGRTRKHASVRHQVWRRVVEETGCSIHGLAVVWGADNSTVRTGIKRAGGLSA